MDQINLRRLNQNNEGFKSCITISGRVFRNCSKPFIFHCFWFCLFIRTEDSSVYPSFLRKRLIIALPAPTGTNTFHFSMIYLLISRPAPLSGLFFLAPCRGWAHFLLVLHIRPSSARCLGQIFLVAPSSLNKPTRARIKSFSVDTVVWDTLTCLRWDLTSLVQDVTGKYSHWIIN